MIVRAICLGQFCPRGKDAMRFTLCKVPTRETKPHHNTGNYERLHNAVLLDTVPTREKNWKFNKNLIPSLLYTTYLFARSVLLIAGKSSREPLEFCFRLNSSVRQILRINQESPLYLTWTSLSGRVEKRQSGIRSMRMLLSVQFSSVQFSVQLLLSHNTEKTTERKMVYSRICYVEWVKTGEIWNRGDSDSNGKWYSLLGIKGKWFQKAKSSASG